MTTNTTQDATAEAPALVRAGEGEARWWLGGLAELQLTAEQTGGRLSLLTVTDPPGSSSPFHVHHDDDETFVLLAGSATFDVGDESFEARAGDVVFGPRGVRHRYTVGPDGLTVLFIMTPGGFERLVRDMSEPALARELPPAGDEEPDLDELQAIARRHRCELLLDD
jgi:quercetin dioxygenase-like cupin family protein